MRGTLGVSCEGTPLPMKMRGEHSRGRNPVGFGWPAGRGALRPVLVVALSALAGCTSPQATEFESSIRYDSVECSAVVAQRDSLARQYPEPPPEVKERMAWGMLAGIHDVADYAGHDLRVAQGKITAMNDSLRRRKCVT